jgi:DNA primase
VVVPGGEIVGFSARVVGSQAPAAGGEAGSEPPKYINSPESSVYKKSKLLFGLQQAREGMQKNGRAVLVEGNFDVITLHQAGFSEVVAPLGTALTLEQVQTLKRLADRVVLLYDGDRAGYKATMHALQTCAEADVEVQVASRPGNARSGGAGPLSGGVDPDSLVAGGGAALLREAIDRATGGIEYFCFEVWSKARANADAKTRALEDVARLAARIENPIKRDLVVDTFAKALDVDPNIVRAALARARGIRHEPGRSGADPRGPASPSTSPEARSPKPEAPPMAELELITLLVDHPSLIASPEADKAFWLLTDDRLRAIYTAAREGTSVLELAPVKLPPPSAQHVLSGKYAGSKEPRAQLVAMLGDLERRKTMLGEAELKRDLVQAQRSGDRVRARLLAQYAEAQRNGDRELIERLAGEISSNRKQAD